MSAKEPQAPARVESLVAAETARRDALIAAEQAVRDKWATAKSFEVDAPADPEERAQKNKFMATFPFPYSNGALHIGHAFSASKAEFAVRFNRLMGKHALFPFGFHCTGMPILACAQKLQKEIASFGCPPVFPVEEAAAEEAEAEEEEETAAPEPDAAPAAGGAAAPVEKKRRKKAKLVAKASAKKYQWEIMLEMGVPAEEIPAFQDPQHWLQYWPPVSVRDVTGLGFAVDWRRTFITTDANPFYDAFIRWQFDILAKKDKLAFGKLMSIITPSSKQVCSDHDRSSGEGVTPQAYTLIKLTMQAPYPAELQTLLAGAGLTADAAEAEGKQAVTVVLPAATLRPETMYGQTNAFVLPTGTYNVYRTKKDEVFICTDRSASNMAFQDEIFQTFDGPNGEFTWGECANRKLGDISGSSLLGCAISAPLAQYDKVYILPLLTILMNKGTGIVTSVPSDAPADYAALMDMKNKPDFRAKFGITDEMVMPFEVVPIIRIKTDEFDSEMAAVDLCKKYGVKSQNDAVLLNKIKDEVYKHGFDKGVMSVGPHAGRLVKDVKDAIKAEMIATGLALPYSEPESSVIARTGEECVAGLVDQWFLRYGEEDWQKEIADYVDSENFNPFNKSIKQRLQFTIGWLHAWGCSRSFGLGSRMSFDKSNSLIESLSDSTIYMAYYTIASILQGGSFTGAGPAGIDPANLTNEVFDYIFLKGAYPTGCTIPQDVLDKMRNEFEFWYPMDLRVSGKDLLNNHLVFSLYNHAAVWGADSGKMPKAFYANGMLMINNKKMSKSEGNFITVADALKMYGADATRFAMASAGDGLEDANFVTQTANAAILRLSKELAFMQQALADTEMRPADSEHTFWDKVLLSHLSFVCEEAKSAFAQMRMLDAAKWSSHEMCNIRDSYRLACGEANIPMHAGVIAKWLEVYTITSSPICPFWAQSMWEGIHSAAIAAGSVPALVVDARWPELPAPDNTLLRQAAYLNAISSNLRGSAARSLAAKAKKDPTAVLTGLTIRVANGYPKWQVDVISKLQEIVSAAPADEKATALANNAVVSGAIKALFPVDGTPASKKRLTNGMAFSSSVKADFATNGEQALELVLPFDEVATMRNHIAYVVRGITGITVENTVIEEYTPTDEETKGPVPTPGKPHFVFP